MLETIYLGSDHAGFDLKEGVKSFLKKKGFKVIDVGALDYNKSDDYPPIIYKTAQYVSQTKDSLGIVFGKSGAGEAVVANKVKGIRCAIGFNQTSIKLMRLHNDANILSLGSEFISMEKAKKLIDIFIGTQFSNEERHIRRLKEIKNIENNE